MNKKAARQEGSELVKNLVVIGASILVAILLEKGGFFDSVINGFQGARFLGTLIAGMFFTSLLTTAPAIVALGTIATTGLPLIPFALVGGAGALIGDLVLFSVVRSKMSPDINNILRRSKYYRSTRLMKSRFFRILTPVIGMFIIASPLPDELGISMLGFSRIPLSLFVPMSYIMNTIGIFVIGLIAVSIT